MERDTMTEQELFEELETEAESKRFNAALKASDEIQRIVLTSELSFSEQYDLVCSITHKLESQFQDISRMLQFEARQLERKLRRGDA